MISNTCTELPRHSINHDHVRILSFANELIFYTNVCYPRPFFFFAVCS